MFVEEREVLESQSAERAAEGIRLVIGHDVLKEIKTRLKGSTVLGRSTVVEKQRSWVLGAGLFTYYLIFFPS